MSPIERSAFSRYTAFMLRMQEILEEIYGPEMKHQEPKVEEEPETFVPSKVEFQWSDGNEEEDDKSIYRPIDYSNKPFSPLEAPAFIILVNMYSNYETIRQIKQRR